MLDPAATFLLDLQWPNLYEPADASEWSPVTYRCKGCGEVMPLSAREPHYRKHQAERRRAEARRQEQIRKDRARALKKARAARGRKP